MRKIIVFGVVFLVGVLGIYGGTNYAGAVMPNADAGAGGSSGSSGTSSGPAASTKFSLNDRVQVSIPYGTRLDVFSNLDLLDGKLFNKLGSHPNRAIGTIIGGPQFSADSGGSWYWNVNVDDGADGWMNETGLVKLQPKFAKDDKVETLTSLRVRTTPMGVYFPGFSPFDLPLVAGVKGTIIDGPTYYKDYVWWQVNWGKAYCNDIFHPFCSDAIGWSAEADIPGTTPYLAKVVTTPAGEPVISGISGPGSLNVGQAGTWVISASDPNGDALIYSSVWGDGTTSSGQSGSSLSHSYSAAGTYTAVFSVSDGKGGVVNMSKQVVVTSSGNQSNLITIISPTSGETWKMGETKTIQWQGTASVSLVNIDFKEMDDTAMPLLEPVVTRIASNQPGTGSYSWTVPTLTQISGHDYIYSIKITSSNKSAAASRVINIVASGGSTTGNSSPVISGVSGPTALNVGQLGTWAVSASDPNSDALTYSVDWGDDTTSPAQSSPNFTHTYSSLPLGYTRPSLLAGAGPTGSGSFVATFLANDGKGGVASKEVNIAVTGTGSNTTSTTPISLSIGARVRNTTLTGLTPNWAGIGFTGFTKDKGIIIAGPQSGTWQVHYDYGGDAWVSEGSLQVTGIPTGKWGFTADNILGRELNTGDGGLVFDPYYASVNYQVSIPSSMAQSSLPPAGVTAQAGSGGKWNCLNTYAVNPSLSGSNFWGDTLCRYERGNIAPLATLTGPAAAFTGVEGTWHLTASDAEGALASYKVDWGDGVISDQIAISGASALKDITHTYSSIGTFTIKLTVTDAGGLIGAASLIVTTTAPCSTRFQSEDRIVVINSGLEHELRVRSDASSLSTKLGTHSNGDLGTIIGGPKKGGEYCWWQINYDVDPDGWSAEGGGDPIQYWLQKTSGGPAEENNDQNATTNGSGPESLVVGANGTWQFTANDSNAQSLTYTVDWGDGQKTGPVTVSGNSLNLSLSHSYSKADFYLIAFKFTNNKGEGDSKFSAVEVVESGSGGNPTTNNKPILATPIGVTSVVVDISNFWQISAVDADLTSLTYTVNWGDGSANSTYTGSSEQIISISHTYTSTGQKTIGVTVSDGTSTDSSSLNITVTSAGNNTTNQPPVVANPSGPASVIVNTGATWQVSATDSGSTVLTYTVNWGDGSTNSTYTGTSGHAVSISHTYTSTGQKTIGVTVSDGELSSAKFLTVNVTSGTTPPPPPPPPPPAKFVIGDKVKVTGDYLQVRASASLSGLAQGSRMTGDLGTITDGPRLSDGYVWWNVNYDTGVDGWSVQDWLEKSTGSGPAVNRAPVIDNFSGPTALAVSAEGTWQITASDPDGDAMTYSIDWGGDTYFWQNNLNPGPQYAGKLTSGVSLNLKYWFRSAKTYSVVLTVTDSKGLSATKTANVVVGTAVNYVPLGGYAPLWNAPDLPPLNNPDKLSTWRGPDGRVWNWVASSGLWKLTYIP